MPTPWSYDHIADIYATDMGRSMPFDDIAWYVERARQAGGPVLELGCGTGRVLLPMARAGLPVTGVDRSLPMLAQLRNEARAQGTAPLVAQMDMRELGLAGHFHCIVLAYSLITYVWDPAQAVALLRDLRERLAPGGQLVVDSFIPKPMRHFTDFQHDYQRAHRQGTLERSKKITSLDQHRHRIERRYVLRDETGRIERVIDTTDVIRPYEVAELHELARGAGLMVADCSFDYGASTSAQDARFITLSLRSA